MKDILILYQILNYLKMRKLYLVGVVTTLLYNGILKIKLLYINLEDILETYVTLNYQKMKRHYIVVVVITQ